LGGGNGRLSQQPPRKNIPAAHNHPLVPDTGKTIMVIDTTTASCLARWGRFHPQQDGDFFDTAVFTLLRLVQSIRFTIQLIKVFHIFGPIANALGYNYEWHRHKDEVTLKNLLNRCFQAMIHEA
jgi:hypothetical protein